jgi:serine/threonine-protein kinase
MFSDRARLVGFFKYHLVLGMCEIHDRRWELAIEQLTIAVAASGGSSFIKAYLGYALAASGREIEARALFRELLMYAKSRYVPATDFAILAVGLGDKNEALDWLDKAYEERSTYLIFVAHDALFDPLRTEPRFQNLLHRVGLASLSPETPPLVNAVNQT